VDRIPEELMYTQNHEWVLLDKKTKIATIGITDFAQRQIGEVVSVGLPEVGLKVAAGDELGVIESVKTAEDVLSALSGKIVAINEELEEAPGLVNIDAYGDGWLYKLEIKDPVEYDELLDNEAYEEYIMEAESDD
jgi:glycine cleavage system H protein